MEAEPSSTPPPPKRQSVPRTTPPADPPLGLAEKELLGHYGVDSVVSKSDHAPHSMSQEQAPSLPAGGAPTATVDPSTAISSGSLPPTLGSSATSDMSPPSPDATMKQSSPSTRASPAPTVNPASSTTTSASIPPPPSTPTPGASANTTKASDGGTPIANRLALPPSEPDSPKEFNYRPLNVKDALSYLEMVRIRFNERPDVYNHFLDIMKEFKTQTIDTPGVIERVSALFTGHPTLIQGFNTFLPPGYRIECSMDAYDTNLITVTTPNGTTTSRTGPAVPLPPLPSGGSSTPGVLTPSAQSASFSSFPLPPPFSGSPAPGAGPAVGTPGVTGSSGAGLPPASPSGPAGAAILGGMGGPAGSAANGKGAPVPPSEFTNAMQYVNKIKTRFDGDKATYQQFLDILQTYQKEQRPITDPQVYQQVTALFKNDPDLLEEFKQFLPDISPYPGSRTGSGGLLNIVAAARPGSSGIGDDKSDRDREREAREREKKKAAEKEKAQPKRRKRVLEKEVAVAPKPGQSKPKRSKHHHNKAEPQSPYPDRRSLSPAPGPSHVGHHSHSYPSNPSNPTAFPDESVFFDRVKRYIDDRATYNEFLKLLNLFVQEIIDARTLIDKAASFLGEGTELMALFKQIMRWDDRVMGEAGFVGASEGNPRGVQTVVSALDRPKVDLNTCQKFGPSYRKLPKNEVTLACSGRDAMCWEVLNDVWVSHPTWASEDAGFSTHKKNVYEDMLHKSEEERHEYDFHIEAIIRTIQVLEPINTRISLMTAEERAHFKLKPGLGGQGKSIYQRIIKKVYGKEHGLEVIQALHETPSIAVPVVLARLKQKDEEWKRAQREWNKVWREVDARNFTRSLDHQGINFKVNDKKSINAKQLVLDIETKRKELLKERAKMIDPSFVRTLPKHQYSYVADDVEVLQDVCKLTLSFLDRTNSAMFSRSDKLKIEGFLRTFVPLFFMIEKDAFEKAFEVPVAPTSTVNASAAGAGAKRSESDDISDEVGSVMDEGDDASVGSSRRKKAGNAGDGPASGDLRKKLLKSAQQKSSKKSRPSSVAGGSAPGSRRASPTPAAGDQMQIDSEPGSPGPQVQDSTAGGDTNPAAQSMDSTAANASAQPSTSMNIPDVWVRCDPSQAHVQGDVEMATASALPQSNEEGTKTTATRTGTFFANNAFYVFLRQFQLLYQRLKTLKEHSAKSAAEPPASGSHTVNPTAVALGLHENVSPLNSRQLPMGTPNPAPHFYEHLLECCELLFEGDMDQTTFEERLRFMFNISGYIMFTVDKVVGALVKQIQQILSDLKSQDLLTLLQRERQCENPTTQYQISYRRQAEQLLGIDENLYRISWMDGTKTMSIQLLAQDDMSVDTAVGMTERWNQYIESYVLSHQTEGLIGSLRPPFLQRNLDPKREIPLSPASFTATGALEIKVCIRTYRLFFVPRTEDSFFKKLPKEAPTQDAEIKARQKQDKNKAMTSWVDKRVGELNS